MSVISTFTHHLNAECSGKRASEKGEEQSAFCQHNLFLLSTHFCTKHYMTSVFLALSGFGQLKEAMTKTKALELHLMLI